VNESIIKTISARALPVRGDDIDTDRIVPARFLRCVTFDDLAEASFRDERFDQDGAPKAHPLNDSRYSGAHIMVVNRNFGCGSSREHAPQALSRWGIRALVGVSFADIFAGNCAAIGVVAVTASEETISTLQKAIEADASTEVALDLETMTVEWGAGAATQEAPIAIAESRRKKFLSGTWDTTGTLLANLEGIQATAHSLPYLAGFSSR